MLERTKVKTLNFFKKYGFYFAIVACIAAVGAAALLALQGESEQPGVDVQKQEAPDLEQTLQSTPTPRITPTPTTSPSATPSLSPSPSPTATATQKPATISALVLTMPVDGEIIRAFSGDELVHNSTLNMWMTHNGVDISGSQGDVVVSALSGTVKETYYDETRGNVVVVEHSSSRVTLYAGLSEISCASGDRINAGDEVGKLGTPPFESNDGPHLHFEFTEDGEFADPVEYFN